MANDFNDLIFGLRTRAIAADPADDLLFQPAESERGGRRRMARGTWSPTGTTAPEPPPQMFAQPSSPAAAATAAAGSARAGVARAQAVVSLKPPADRRARTSRTKDLRWPFIVLTVGAGIAGIFLAAHFSGSAPAPAASVVHAPAPVVADSEPAKLSVEPIAAPAPVPVAAPAPAAPAIAPTFSEPPATPAVAAAPPAPEPTPAKKPAHKAAHAAKHKPAKHAVAKAAVHHAPAARHDDDDDEAPAPKRAAAADAPAPKPAKHAAQASDDESPLQ